MRHSTTIALVALTAIATAPAQGADRLFDEFAQPKKEYGPVPIWWFSGDPLDLSRMKWQMDRMREAGVFNVVYINLAPSGTTSWCDADDPPFFSEEWWRIIRELIRYAKQTGMRFWMYDQLGFASAGLDGQLIREDPECQGWSIAVAEAEVSGPSAVELTPPVDCVAAAAAGMRLDDRGRMAELVDLTAELRDGTLRWRCPEGTWRVMLFYRRPQGFDYLDSRASARLLDAVFGEFERRIGEHLGRTVPGTFQDELHAMQNWTDGFLTEFRRRKGYDLRPHMSALFHDIGPDTARIRCDYFDVAAHLAEDAFFKPEWRWHEDRNMTIGMDQSCRDADPINGQRLYVDYFRTQRWYQAPGQDQNGDARPNASIAHLYERPRVWQEGFYNSGWGQSIEELTHTLNRWLAAGSNLYNPHAFYYSTHGGWWEWAPPCTSFRQPYWDHYKPFAEYVSRACFLLSQGVHVCDTAVLYPSLSVQADTSLRDGVGEAGEAATAAYWGVSNALTRANRGFDTIDDESIRRAAVADGALHVAGEQYRVVILPSITTIARQTLRQLVALAESGGTVIIQGPQPVATAEGGKGDPLLGPLWARLLRAGAAAATEPTDAIAAIDELFPPDVQGPVQYIHRRIDGRDVYFIASGGRASTDLVFRTVGRPTVWDPWDGSQRPATLWRPDDAGTWVRVAYDSSPGLFVVFEPGELTGPSVVDANLVEITAVHDRELGVGVEGLVEGEQARVTVRRGDEVLHGTASAVAALPTIELEGPFEYSLHRTLDNRHGDFDWPPTDGLLPVECRVFRYAEEGEVGGSDLGWHAADFDDSDWQRAAYTFGPRFMAIGPFAGSTFDEALPPENGVDLGASYDGGGGSVSWREVWYSDRFGIERDPAYGRMLGPKGRILDDFIDLGARDAGDLEYLSTNVFSAEPQAATLRLRFAGPVRVWLNGEMVLDRPTGGTGEERVPTALTEGHNTLLIKLGHTGESLRGYMQFVEPTPDHALPKWIWHEPTSSGRSTRYFRKGFRLASQAERALLAVTADNGYTVYVDGQRVGADAGIATSHWQTAENYDIARHLTRGDHCIAIEGVNMGGSGGLLVALQVELADGSAEEILSDETWRASAEAPDGWIAVGFDDSAWSAAHIVGSYPMEPWNQIRGLPMEPVELTTLPEAGWLLSPVGDRSFGNPGLDVTFDADPDRASRHAWLRFDAPNCARRITFPPGLDAELYVDGRRHDPQAELPAPTTAGPVHCALRVKQRPGVYAGAVLRDPVRFETGRGLIAVGSWDEQGLSCYSGGMDYELTVDVPRAYCGRRVVLDLGSVRGTAEVFVNGRSAGVRLWTPYRFGVGALLRPGENDIRVRVLGTLGPHYSQVLATPYAFPGQDQTGIFGPVRLVPLNQVRISARPGGEGAAAAELVNYADPALGATVRASSEQRSGRYAAASILLGDTTGATWARGGGWNDGTIGELPDWIEVRFPTEREIARVEVFTYEPALRYGLRDYELRAEGEGSDWRTLDTVRGNMIGMRVHDLAAVRTRALRLFITQTNSNDGYSRVLAIRALGPPGQ